MNGTAHQSKRGDEGTDTTPWLSNLIHAIERTAPAGSILSTSTDGPTITISVKVRRS